jgi:hypothetical protein
MAAYAVSARLKADLARRAAVSCVVMGVLTATFGGVIRDVLAHEPSVLLQRELYVTPRWRGRRRSSFCSSWARPRFPPESPGSWSPFSSGRGDPLEVVAARVWRAGDADG